MSKATKALVTKVKNGTPLTKAEQAQFVKMTYGDSEALVKEFNGDEELTDTWMNLAMSPPMVEYAEKMRKQGKIQKGLEQAVEGFNNAYDFYLASEAKRIGEAELGSVVKAEKPGRMEAIPELEDAFRRARELGDPSAAISQYQQGIDRANLGAIRAAQLGSRGQAGALGAQGQALHMQNLAAQGQIPLLAQQIKGQGLDAMIPLIAQKQGIEAANLEAAVSMYPYDLDRQLREEEAAGLAIQSGTAGQRDALRGFMSQVPSLAGNLYSNQYSHLPPQVAPHVASLDFGLKG
jgi:hypothetical protein